MRVIIAEKPQAGRDMADVLGVIRKERGFVQCKGDTYVTWAIGHLIRLKPADSYPEFAEWSLDTLPVIPEPMLYEVDVSGEQDSGWSKMDQFNCIKSLVCDPKCTEVVIAGDAGREGEGIVRLILKQAWGSESREGVAISRLWIDDLTQATIERGFRNLIPGHEKEPLGWAAELRGKADYIIGMTASRLYTLYNTEVTQNKVMIPAGRVQTPTLHIVFKREMEIRNFVSKPFYEIHAKFTSSSGEYVGKWYRPIGEKDVLSRFEDRSHAERLLQKVSRGKGRVVQFEVKTVKRHAPHFLELTALQTAARKQLGFGAEKTAQIAQKLYDQKLISYTRTESKHLTEEVADKLQQQLGKLKSSSKYAAWFPEEVPSIRNIERFVNNEKAKEHHAIVVTDVQPSLLSSEEEAVYEIILQRTLAAFLPPGQDVEIKITTEIAGELFASKSIQVKEAGWRSIMKPESESEVDTERVENQSIKLNGPLEEGSEAIVGDAKLHSGKTTAPKRLAEDELIRAMENAGKILEHEDEEDEGLALLRERGIGTKATRTHIIKNLMTSQYIESKKNLIYLTPKGEFFMATIRTSKLASVELTGEWEYKLKLVEDRKVAPEVIWEDIKQFARDILDSGPDFQRNVKILATKGYYIDNPLTKVGVCPICQKPVVERKKFYGCTGFKDGCSFTLPKVYGSLKIPPKAVPVLIEGKDLQVKMEGQFGAYFMMLSLQKGVDSNEVIQYRMDLRKPDVTELSLGPCPKCRKPVVEKSKFYGCTGYTQGCTFSLPKVFLSKNLTATQITAILEKGQTGVIKGFKGKEDKPFDAKLYYDKGEDRLKFLFDNQKNSKSSKKAFSKKKI
ncbi:hypothetical protein A8L34_27685 [Bacillus sp. FJAT-27264]|uniref:DNA topoisomerase n=1 Tax=Paenibacillus sp. (strain DSM 101736 / FJAT-27264) TaxID=1850362 RepID=UPI000807FF72|nr:DNA topoisomerase [Bacillus sp. FJAT-27264]OBZ15833.1 hypothetical protein A8L34_27685 [Bacillus sp. FJAT-27264]